MSPIHCTSCGAANAADAKFCQACGAKIQTIGESPPPSGDVSQGAQFPAGTPQSQYSKRVPYRPYAPAAAHPYAVPQPEPLSTGEIIGFGCLTLLIPIVGLIMGFIWTGQKRKGAIYFLAVGGTLLVINVISVFAIAGSSFRTAATESYAQGVLATVRSAETPYYVRNGKYGTFGELVASDFLDSRFQGTTFTERDVVFSISVGADGKTFVAQAVLPNGAGTLTLTESGKIVITETRAIAGA